MGGIGLYIGDMSDDNRLLSGLIRFQGDKFRRLDRLPLGFLCPLNSQYIFAGLIQFGEDNKVGIAFLVKEFDLLLRYLYNRSLLSISKEVSSKNLLHFFLILNQFWTDFGQDKIHMNARQPNWNIFPIDNRHVDVSASFIQRGESHHVGIWVFTQLC